MKKNKIRRIVYILLAAVIILAIAGYPIVTRHYSITTDKVQGSVKIAVISDLHSCYYGKNMSTLTKRIDKESPDVIMLTGDIFDDKLDNRNTEILLDCIGERYPCYYVIGNHEKWTGDPDGCKRKAEKYGVTVLAGDTKTVDVNGAKFTVSGIDDPSGANETFYEQLGKASKSARERGLYSILLSHRPERVDSYISDGFDLILSGHAHGGQWRIPFLVNGLYAPDQGLFPEYAGGRYDFGEQVFIVSRGLAREKDPIPRFFNNAELVVITIN